MLIGLLLATLATAQVHLSLSLLPDGKTYQVSMTPERTWESPWNTTGSVQVVVAAPVGEGFLVKDLKSQIPGVSWLDDTYVESPPAAPGWTFISFTIKELGTKGIRYEAGVETPLFTFRSASGDCAKGLQLLDNGDPLVKAVVKNNFNITQSLTVLGMRGNAFAGIAANKVECPELPGAELPETYISKVKASPIPAGSFVDFSWVNGEELFTLELQLFNEQGQIIQQHKLNTKPGAQTFHAELEGKTQGIYSATFIANSKQRETVRLAVMP
jgi:hypothetical protein